jgi:hypothetical protein
MFPFQIIDCVMNPHYGVYIGDECVNSGFESRAAAWGWVARCGQKGVRYKVKRQ